MQNYILNTAGKRAENPYLKSKRTCFMLGINTHFIIRIKDKQL